MGDHLDSTNLVPFKRRQNGFQLPRLAKGHDEQMVDDVDSDLRPEELGYVRHYLAYADILLRNNPEPDSLIAEHTQGPSNGDKANGDKTKERPGANASGSRNRAA